MYERIERLMKAHGMKKADLAKALGFGQSLLTDWSQGKTSPSSKQVFAIADYFNISTDYLYGRDEYVIAEDEREIIKMYRALNTDCKVNVMHIMYELKELNQKLRKAEQTDEKPSEIRSDMD